MVFRFVERGAAGDRAQRSPAAPRSTKESPQTGQSAWPMDSMFGSLIASLTAQQASAVSRREVSVVLASGAGCGKTHVLTERYLAHLRADGAEVSQIVAITFTDRAARQMRERIRKALLAN